MTYKLPDGLHARFHHERCTPVAIAEAGHVRREHSHLAPKLTTLRRESFAVNGWPISPRGGLTVCYIEDETLACVARGEARCSDLDNFSYRIGRDIAFGRALKALNHA